MAVQRVQQSTRIEIPHLQDAITTAGRQSMPARRQPEAAHGLLLLADLPKPLAGSYVPQPRGSIGTCRDQGFSRRGEGNGPHSLLVPQQLVRFPARGHLP